MRVDNADELGAAALFTQAQASPEVAYQITISKLKISRATGWISRPRDDLTVGKSVRVCGRRLADSKIYAALIRSVRILLTSSLRSAFHVSWEACMRIQTPSPSPNNLPSRTAIAGDTGLRSRKNRRDADGRYRAFVRSRLWSAQSPESHPPATKRRDGSGSDPDDVRQHGP